MANDKKQPIKCLFDQWQNLNICEEVHGRDIYFVKSERCYRLTGTDAEAVAVRLLLPLHRKRQNYTTVIFNCMHICETAPNTTHI